MKKIRSTRAGILAVVAVGIGTAFAGVATAAAQAHPEAPRASDEVVDAGAVLPTSSAAYDFGETLSELSGKELEITFIAGIIPHHQAAITMAELELERGVSPDIRTHAENIISQQQSEIEQLTRWLDEWYGLTPEEAKQQAPEEARQEMQRMDEETQKRIEELKGVEAGKEFDIAFVQRMIPHHQAGIIEFLEPQARAPHAELRVSAAQGITIQEAEAADFRTWLSGQVGEF